MLSIDHRCHLRHSATALNECEMMCEGGSARASRSAMRCHATHLYRPMRSLSRRPVWQALRRFPPTPGGGPPPLGSKDWTFRRSPEQLGAASPLRRCRRPRDDSPPNRLQRAFITPLHPLHPLVCGKIFFGLSCASKVTSVGSMPLVSWLGSFRAGRYGGASCLRVKVLKGVTIVTPSNTLCYSCK